MDRKICLDSDILIDLSKGVNEIGERIDNLDAIFYITSINLFEIWFGRRNKENLKQFIESFNILDFDLDSALLAGDILRKLKDSGLTIDFRDLFIASICIINKIELMTNNLNHFERLKNFGLKLV